MTVLKFEPQPGRAAVWLLHETGLDEHERVSVTHGRVYVAVTLDEDWHGWSSGELVLIDLLVSLAGQASTFELRDLARLDEPTRKAAVLAIGAAYGVRVAPAPRWADLYGIDPDYTGGVPVDEFIEANRGTA